MKAFFHHFAYEFKTGFRDKSRLLMLYLFPLVYAALMGAIMGKLNPLFMERMVPSMAMFVMLCAGMLSLPGSMVGARNSGIWRSFKINAVPKAAVLAVPVLGMAIHGLIASGIIMAMSVLAFKASLPANMPVFVLVWLLSWAAVSGLGSLIGVIAPNERYSTLLAQFFFIPSIILGGLMIPAAVLSKGLRTVAMVFPASHAMSLFAEPFSILPLIVLSGIAAVSWAACAVAFRWSAKG
ncbi:MAG: ABC transporter permease [Spirochaetales bacterium]|nr:ABC transporter permease [Spirochaetales bacterium]